MEIKILESELANDNQYRIQDGHRLAHNFLVEIDGKLATLSMTTRKAVMDSGYRRERKGRVYLWVRDADWEGFDFNADDSDEEVDRKNKLNIRKRREVLKALFPKITGHEAPAINWNWKAGCSCGCSPGFVQRNGLPPGENRDYYFSLNF